MRTLFASLLLGLLVASPSVALACSVCFSGGVETRVAYRLTALALTLMPFFLFGGFALWLRAKARRIRDEAATGS